MNGNISWWWKLLEWNGINHIAAEIRIKVERKFVNDVYDAVLEWRRIAWKCGIDFLIILGSVCVTGSSCGLEFY